MKGPIRKRGSWLVVVGLLVLTLMCASVVFAGKINKLQGWLGVYIQEVDEDIQEEWNLTSDSGVVIADVIDDSPAEKAGLKPGDVILAFDGKDVMSSNRLTRWIRQTPPDTAVKLHLLRDGKPLDITVTMGKQRRDRVYYIGDHDEDNDYDEDLLHNYYSPHVVIPPIDIPRIDVFDGDRNHLYFSGAGGHIGVELRDLNDQLAEYFGLENAEGVLVEKVLKGGPAREAGIKAGDVIISINGKDVGNVDDVVDEISDYDEGDKIDVVVMRDRQKQTYSVTVEDNGYSPGRRIYVGSPKKFDRDHWSRTLTLFDDDKDTYNDISDEIEEALEELCEDLEEVRQELKEALEEWEGR